MILQEYMPHTRVGLGLSSMADGRRYYQACLRWHLSYDMSPEEVHQIGFQEVERIHSEMVKVRKSFLIITLKTHINL